ncbi:SRPBCC family protein [Streptomyces sp. AA0539]|uniref:SRPBCC family protein n=1 Tax=Streptomyces sp. AA0539 TaxID=1210045 RepID=UPI0002F24A25|nr:SRPBCC family protein [Streptomyces sp. AA0539]
MAKHDDTATQDGLRGSLERLGHELTGYLGARAHRLTKHTGDRVQQFAGRVAGAPAEHAKHMVKDATVEPVKKAIPGLGGKKDEDGDGGGGGGGGNQKVTTIIEAIDVGAPLRTCYNHWTSFEDFGEYMKGVQHVQEKDDTETEWRAKVGPSTRSWTATVQELEPEERITWTSEGDKGTNRGVVSFHELAPRLTRIVVVVEYSPAGFFEKTANLWRAQGRRLRLDLKRFQSHVMLADAEDEPEGRHQKIHEGEIAEDGDDDGEEREDEETDDTDDAVDEDFEDEDEDEDEDDEDEDDEDDEEEDEKPRKRGRR